MAKTIADMIGETIFRKTLEAVQKPSVPVAPGDEQRVAYEVEKAIKPIVVNATNSEPWFRSRIYIGLITAGVGAIAQHFGVQISGADIQLVTNSVPEVVQAVGTVMEAIGLLVALYGRIRGASLKPLGQ